MQNLENYIYLFYKKNCARKNIKNDYLLPSARSFIKKKNIIQFEIKIKCLKNLKYRILHR